MDQYLSKRTYKNQLDENGQHITDPSEILLEQQHFYKTLCSSRNINDYDESFFLTLIFCVLRKLESHHLGRNS
jgi:hypothetical protein